MWNPQPYRVQQNTVVNVGNRCTDVSCCNTCVDCSCSLQIAGVYYCSSCGNDEQTDLSYAPVMLISCIDFRLRDNVVHHINELGLTNQYDEFILAGCSLGYNGITGYSGVSWATTMDEHIKAAYNLHKAYIVTLVDHMSCGAYKIQYPDLSGQMNTQAEYDKHIINLNAAANTLISKFGPSGTYYVIPNFQVKKIILSIDGKTAINIDTYGTYPF